MFAENIEYEILTPSGWKDFRGVTSVDNKITFRLSLSNGSIIEATAGHNFFRNNKKIQVKDLLQGDSIDLVNGISSIIQIEKLELTTVYDIVEVSDEHHRFLVNGNIVTKNCDEFAFVQPNIATEFWTSISPTLATGGNAIITSTPNSDEDEFAVIWKESQTTFDEFGNELTDGKGINGFHGFRAEWNEHPDRDEEWRQVEMGRIGEERFRREYGCEFLIYDETLISSLKLTELLGRDPVHKMGQVRWYKKVQKGSVYVAALDPSLGTGGDYGAIQVFELPNFEQVAEWHHNITPIQQQVKIFRDILKELQDQLETDKFDQIYWSVENNTVGESALVVIDNLGEETFPGLFLSEPARKGHVKKFRKGFNTTHGNKIAACAKVKFMIEEEKMKIFSKPLISELKTYIAAGTSFKAKEGQHDDLVASLLLTVRISQILAEWDPQVFENLKVKSDWLMDGEFEMPMPIFISSGY